MVNAKATSDETTDDSPLPSLLKSRKNTSQEEIAYERVNTYMFLNGKYIYVQKWQEYEPNNKQSTQRMLQGGHPSTHPMKEASSNLSEDTGNFGGVIDSPWPVPITDESETLATSDETTEHSPLPTLLKSRKIRQGNVFLNGKYKESTKKVPLGQGKHQKSATDVKNGSKSKESNWIEL